MTTSLKSVQLGDSYYGITLEIGKNPDFLCHPSGFLTKVWIDDLLKGSSILLCKFDVEIFKVFFKIHPFLHWHLDLDPLQGELFAFDHVMGAMLLKEGTFSAGLLRRMS